jgi:hypothetical protein
VTLTESRLPPLICTASTDPFARGLDYLYGVRCLAPDPEMIGIVYDLQLRTAICTWIGQQIESINRQLQVYLQLCHACFDPREQPRVQILAAPLIQSFGVDAVCNVFTQPKTIIVDVGRVIPQHWLALVAHEYAHAQAGSPGHHTQFSQSLRHLCLGLGIALPAYPSDQEERWQSFPPCLPTLDPLAFWRGNGESLPVISATE